MSDKLNNDPMDNHKCRMIAKSPSCAPGRELWVGKLLEPIPDHPNETHCIHITTPYKSVVFGVMSGDAAMLAVLAQILHFDGHPINARWVQMEMQRWLAKEDETP
jgi:hypothetical protein